MTNGSKRGEREARHMRGKPDPAAVEERRVLTVLGKMNLLHHGRKKWELICIHTNRAANRIKERHKIDLWPPGNR